MNRRIARISDNALNRIVKESVDRVVNEAEDGVNGERTIGTYGIKTISTCLQRYPGASHIPETDDVNSMVLWRMIIDNLKTSKQMRSPVSFYKGLGIHSRVPNVHDVNNICCFSILAFSITYSPTKSNAFRLMTSG